MLGLFVGVYIYDAIFPFVSELGGEQRFVTWSMLLDVRYGYVAILSGLFFLAMCLTFDKFDPSKKFDPDQANKPLLKREWGWLSTGAIAGVCIFASTALGEYLSFAGGFLALGAHMASFMDFSMQSVPSLSESTQWRAMLVIGLFPGALLSSYLAGTMDGESVTPLFKEAFGPNIALRGGLVFFGAVLMIIGALIGGGCTTGAFMSGWPTLSVGSFVMGGVFFGTAMLTAHVIYFRKYRLLLSVRQRLALNLAND